MYQQLLKNPFVRKGLARMKSVPRRYKSWTASEEDYIKSPAVLCNSFPKSGTHLLLQIAESLPGVMHYGSFIASVPAIRFQLRDDRQMLAEISKVAPGEVLGAHLYHTEQVAAHVAYRSFVHYFIYRDPRDVVVSETHYLTNDAWWHGMHKPFKACSSLEERIALSIRGMADEHPDAYPDIRQRFEKYRPWIDSPDVCAVRFEDLIGDSQTKTVAKIVDHYVQRTKYELSPKELVADAIAAIAPAKSHTYRKGEAGGWASDFTPGLKEVFKEVTADLLIQLGYERDMDW